MPRKKVTDISGNGGMKKKRASGKRKERDFSSDDEFDYEQENNKKSGKPTTKPGLQPVTVADDIKEKIVSCKQCLKQIHFKKTIRNNLIQNCDNSVLYKNKQLKFIHNVLQCPA